jgi:PAS domain S-box-containing protein
MPSLNSTKSPLRFAFRTDFLLGGAAAAVAGAFFCAAAGAGPWPGAVLAAVAGGLSAAAVFSRRRRGETVAEQKLRALLESVTDAIYFKDLDLRYRFVNPAWAVLAGRAAETMLGRTDRELFGESGAEREDGDRRALSGEQLEDLREYDRDGRALYQQCLMTPLRDVSGKVTGLLGVVRDVSERRRLEENAIQTQKMEGITRLAGGIAHDFNNFLTVIQANGSFLAESLPPEDPRRADVVDILESSRQAADLTRQLLIFSRRQVVKPRSLDVSETILGMGKLLRRMLPADIELVYCLSETPSFCWADPGQIEQMALNLVAHGRDAMPRGGKLTVTTAPLTLASSRANRWCRLKAGDYIEISVADSGPELAAHVRENLFEPFYLDGAYGINVGLALPTVLVIVRQLGGGISVESGKDGTVFKIHLPVVKTAQEASRVPAVGPAPEILSDPETILLVEDNARVRSLARRILAERGYRILEAQHGEDGLKVADLHKGEIDIVVSDIVMPLMNGDEMARILRQRVPGLKVLFMSGYNESLQLGDTLTTGNSEFLAKPFHPGELAEKVRGLLDAPVER